MDIDIDLVLAPVDASDRAETAVEYALAVADRYDADLHVLHVLAESVQRGLDAGDVTAESVARHHRAFDDRIRDRLPEGVSFSTSSAAGFSVSRLSRTPGSVTLDAAEDVGADFLVVPRERPSDDPEETLGKAALYVLQYASQPVLSV